MLGRLGAQAPLGFTSGLPVYLIGPTLTAWLAMAGTDVATIGLFALVSLPYNLKFVWAPLLDRFRLPFLGRRRGWIALFQLATGAGIAALAATDPVRSPGLLAAIALALGAASASLDIVVDAYRTDSLRDEERGRGIAFYVAGYRTALIVAGSAALVIGDHGSWRAAYAILAGLALAGVAVTFAVPEPDVPAGTPATLRSAVIEPWLDLIRRPAAAIAIAVVVLYQLGDLLVRQMILPFLLSLDYTATQVGLVQNLLGMVATIAGCAAGGAMVDRIGTQRALIAFGILQALANAGYLALAAAGPSWPLFLAAIAIDSACNGLGMAALLAYMMALCDRRFSATQYALLSSASSVLGRILAGSSGAIVTWIDWPGFFALTIGLAAPGLALVAFAGARARLFAAAAKNLPAVQ